MPMDLKQTYNLITEDWHKDHLKDVWWIEGTDKFISFLKPGDAVLDVGCGTGVKSKYLIERGVEVVGIDFSEKMIEIAKRDVPQAKFYVMDLYDIGQLKKSFDGVFAQAVLLHVPKSKIESALGAMIGKLKKGGYLYVAVKEIRRGGKDEEIKTENDYGYEYKRFFSYFTLDEIEGYLEKFNIAICYKNITKFGKTNWIQIIGKS